MLNDARLTRASASILADIQASNFAHVELLIVDVDPNSGSTSSTDRTGPARVLRALWHDRRELAWSLYRWMDRRRVRLPDDPVSLEDCSAMLEGIRTVRVAPIGEGPGIRLPDTVAQTVRDARLDVIVQFGFAMLRGEILDGARFGVWAFRYGDNERYRGGPPAFWEMVEDNPVSAVVLERLTEKPYEGAALAKAVFATDMGSLARNRVQPYFGSTHLVIQKLWELHQWGWQRLVERGVQARSYKGRRQFYRTPGNLEVIRWLAPQVIGKAVRTAARLFGRRHNVEHWRIAVRTTDGPGLDPAAVDMTGFRWIESPKGTMYADPFVVERAGRTWMFFEDLSYRDRRGSISCAEVAVDGRLKAPEVVLASAGHLSYPCVFVDASVA